MPVLKNAKHERFAQGVAKGNTAEEAYRLAGYEPSIKNAQRLKCNEGISVRISEILNRSAEKAEISIASVLSELAKIGFSNISDFIDGGDAVNLSQAPRDKLAAIASIETETTYERRKGGKPVAVQRTKLKFWDKRAALVDIGKHLGMFEKVKDDPTELEFETDAPTLAPDEPLPSNPVL